MEWKAAPSGYQADYRTVPRQPGWSRSPAARRWFLTARRSGWLDVADIGQIIAKVLLEDGHLGKDYTLTGPEALNFDEVAEILSTLLVDQFVTSSSAQFHSYGIKCVEGNRLASASS